MFKQNFQTRRDWLPELAMLQIDVQLVDYL